MTKFIFRGIDKREKTFKLAFDGAVTLTVLLTKSVIFFQVDQIGNIILLYKKLIS
jgi:hypothetical protein